MLAQRVDFVSLLSSGLEDHAKDQEKDEKAVAEVIVVKCTFFHGDCQAFNGICISSHFHFRLKKTFTPKTKSPNFWKNKWLEVALP